MTLVVVSCVVLLGCAGSSSSGPPRPRASAAATPSALDQARAYERGNGVARDYRSAAAIYQQQCASGAGDVAACRRLLEATLRGRGVDPDRGHAVALARALCDRQGDGAACLVIAFSEENPSAEVGVAVDKFLATPCDRKHLDRCELPRDPFSFLSQSSSVQDKNRAFDDRGCALGVLEACERLRYSEGDVHDRAMTKLGAACGQGDANACEAVGQPIDPAVLCKAHDYAACAALGCAGDAHAARIAAEHGAPVDCDRSRIAPVATGIEPAKVAVFDSIDFDRIETRPGRSLRYQISNRSDRAIDVFLGEVYGYDASGKQVSRVHFEFRTGLEPGAATTLDIGHPEGESFEPCVEVISFVDEPSHLARCPAQKAKGARWGDGRENLELRINFDDLPLADDWAGTLEPMLAEPFEQTRLGIRVRAVSDAALMMPSAVWDLRQLATRTPTIQIPLVRQPTTIAYRVTGVDDLKLSATTLARIFLGQITTWNDPAIVKDNPNATFPSIPIVVFQMSNSDDQLRLTTYLTTAARGVWKLGATKQGAFSEGNRFVRTYDIASMVAAQEGAIAFVGPGLAEKAKLRVARIRNARNVFVAPTPDAVTRGDYPIVSSRSLYVRIQHPDQATADAAREYARWLATDGLPIFERMGFGLEPDAARQAGLRKLSTLTVAP